MLRDLGVAAGEPVGFFLVVFLQGSSEALRPVGEGVTAPPRKGKRARLPCQEGDGKGQLRHSATCPQLPSTAGHQT